MLTAEDAYRQFILENDSSARRKIIKYYELCYTALCKDIIFVEGQERDEAWQELHELADLITELQKLTNEEYIQKYRWGA
jgi:hypothetical protein